MHRGDITKNKRNNRKDGKIDEPREIYYMERDYIGK